MEMIGDAAFWRRWEDELCRSQKADYERNLQLVESLWEEARLLGVLSQENALDNIPAQSARERFRDLLVAVAGEFARRSIPYMLIDGQAVLLYGEPR
ncbi:MAG: hypothetical protein KatS3mg023_0072 [Armatimonadota bacterium]|nr:MAG: hypothetical protein KatS3mg023_0072 [Armatimonadota bacterium]